jgi:hypothetical protein
MEALVTTLHLDTLTETDALLDRACARIAPTWPLDRFIAVNPFWEMTASSPAELAGELASLSGARLVMPRAWYREQWRAGRLDAASLRAAIERSGARCSVAQLEALLGRDEPDVERRLRVVDVVDRARDVEQGLTWREYVTQSVGALCAAYFDEGQARVRPTRDEGLYTTFRRQALHDATPRLLLGLDGFASLVRGLPPTATSLAAIALAELDVAAHEHERYLTGLLLDLQGWAAWCAYRRWTARLAGRDDHQIRELLAIMLAWELLLLRAGGRELASRWKLAMAAWPKLDAAARRARSDDWLLQKGVELAWRRPIVQALVEAPARTLAERPAVQAVFCIDVRSEPYRRALEAEVGVSTLGFAGFFGLPIEVQALGSSETRPQLPGLLAPRLRAHESGASTPEQGRRRARALALQQLAGELKGGPASGFAFVEALGLSFAAKLLGDSLARAHASEPSTRPQLVERVDGTPLELDARVELAAGMLRAMSLVRGFARLVVLVGHGSSTRNNAHAAGLDCGACCGQTGEVNARLAAALLDDAQVRAELATRGIVIPDDTHFIAALHDTTTDEVRLLDIDALPDSHAADLAALQRRLAAASERARARRAPRVGVQGDAKSLLAGLQARARSWAEPRPEWGLAGNAAFIAAPRACTRELDLQGRAFLHEYDWRHDEGFAVLELIMTAPLVVAHWINLQYYASTVDNQRYGSGNKLLHDVVGGHIGVLEGNGGDLRIGLPMQSLHDGERWVHEPLRLTAMLAAPLVAIEQVLAKHAKVRELVEREWIDLVQLDVDARVAFEWRAGGWVGIAGARVPARP